MKNKFLELIKDKGKRTLAELIAGVTVINLISLIGLIFVKNRLAYLNGQLLGYVTAVFLAVNMYRTLEKVLLLNKDSAKSKTKLYAFLRMLVMFGALAVSVIFQEYINLIPVMIGILALKLSAEAQPLTEMLFTKCFGAVPEDETAHMQPKGSDSSADEGLVNEDTENNKTDNNQTENDDLDVEIEAIFGRNEELNAAIKEAIDFEPKDDASGENVAS